MGAAGEKNRRENQCDRSLGRGRNQQAREPVEELEVLRRANPRMGKDMWTGTERAGQTGRDVPTKPKDQGLGADTPGRLRDDPSLLKSKPKAPLHRPPGLTNI